MTRVSGIFDNMVTDEQAAQDHRQHTPIICGEINSYVQKERRVNITKQQLYSNNVYKSSVIVMF